MGEEKMLSLYEVLGKEMGIRQLVDRFYDFMDTEAIAKEIRAMHPPSLASSREKTYLFLLGWAGGPQLYMQKYGHPRLRARHLPFPIDSAARDAWMHCMRKALEECIAEEYIRKQIEDSFWRVANHMRNKEG